MINYNNHNITGISYNNHSIKYVYGCGGNLVWSGDTPTPPTGRKWVATYSDSHSEYGECGAYSAITNGEIVKTNLVSVEIGNCVSGLTDYAFSSCVILSSVTFSNTITTIGNGTFDGCVSLSSLTLPYSLVNISGSSFINCSGLTSVTFAENSQLENIGNSAFTRCNSLISIDIPSGVTSIGYNAFWNCTSLTAVTVNATTPPTLGSYAFNNTNNCPIYVPCNSVEAYKTTTGWSNYASRIQAIP